MTTEAKPKAGLEDVVAASSAICYLDGDRGVLAYYGYDIHDLAKGATFEEVCYLLWHGRLPDRAELGDLQSQVAAATLTDLYSAIVGAIGALKGPLHGGANADVMRLLIEIGPEAPPERVDEAIRAKLAKKIKIPGFGHRVYRTEDPRATH